MWGTALLALIVFLILLVVTRAAVFYRGRWSVAEGFGAAGESPAAPAVVGVASGVAVLLLLLVLYLGITRWDWANGSMAGGATLRPPVTSPATSPSH